MVWTNYLQYVSGAHSQLLHIIGASITKYLQFLPSVFNKSYCISLCFLKGGFVGIISRTISLIATAVDPS